MNNKNYKIIKKQKVCSAFPEHSRELREAFLCPEKSNYTPAALRGAG